MKNFLLLSVFLLTTCQKKETIVEKPIVIRETIEVEKAPEALPSEPVNEVDDLPVDPAELKDLSGKHNLTLQWISWDKPGTVYFKKIGDNLYKVSGSQKKGKEYLTIDGQITQVSAKKLGFEGTITHSTAINGNGAECVKTGSQIFLSTQNRKYWRMQDMANCDGVATDYIDIYF